MSLEGEVDNVNLAVICHSYNNFQKDPIDILAPRVSSVNVFVRVNPFSELGKYLSIPQIERFSSVYKIDRIGIPENEQVHTTPLWYIPKNRDYNRLSERHYAHVKSFIKERGT